MTQQATLWRRCRRTTLGTLLLVVMAGCGEEPRIAQYEVSREAETLDFRRLGAIIPFQDKVWYFKLDGPVKSLADEKDKFDRFVQSIQFTSMGKEPVNWKLPEGWRQEEGDGKFRYATIRLGPPEKGMELTVIPLPRDTDDWLLKNVNRWRDQIGLAPIRESELSETTKKAKIDGKDATLVDLLGRKPRSKMPPMALARPEPPKARPVEPDGAAKPSYELPPGWRPLRPKVNAFVRQLLSFEVGEGDKIAKITATPARGDLLSNVNRWRREDLGLPATTEADMKRDLKELKLAGVPAYYVDLHSPQAGQRILGVIVPMPEDSLFFKMIGPADLVSEQQRNFDGFIRSFRFGDDGK